MQNHNLYTLKVILDLKSVHVNSIIYININNIIYMHDSKNTLQGQKYCS